MPSKTTGNIVEFSEAKDRLRPKELDYYSSTFWWDPKNGKLELVRVEGLPRDWGSVEAHRMVEMMSRGVNWLSSDLETTISPNDPNNIVSIVYIYRGGLVRMWTSPEVGKPTEEQESWWKAKLKDALDLVMGRTGTVVN